MLNSDKSHQTQQLVWQFTSFQGEVYHPNINISLFERWSISGRCHDCEFYCIEWKPEIMMPIRVKSMLTCWLIDKLSVHGVS